MITPWGAPPYSTPDIWLDSERNGWDVYRYTDGAGNPTGQGDDAWVNHDNRVYVRVHNLGPGLATDVRVQVYINSPPCRSGLELYRHDRIPDHRSRWRSAGLCYLESNGGGTHMYTCRSRACTRERLERQIIMHRRMYLCLILHEEAHGSL